MPRKKPAEGAYLLRVDLLELSPPVWRKLLVRGGSTLADLHDAIQVAFAWEDRHLHEFELRDCFYGDDEEAGEEYPVWQDSRRTSLDSLGLQVGDRIAYVYDFGDGWVHRIEVKDVGSRLADQAYPACVEGRGATPPEDSGGPLAFDARRMIAFDPDAVSRGLVELQESPRSITPPR